MDLFDILKEDHKKVSELLKTLEETTDTTPDARKDLYDELEKELSAHLAAEEKFLYPRLEKIEKTREIALESIEEHRIVKRLLDELADVETQEEEWTAKLEVLKENIEHHVKEEEKEMFPKAKKALSKEQQEEIADNTVKLKAKLAKEINERRRVYHSG